MFHADAESHNLVVATFEALDVDQSGDITQADFGNSKGGQAFFAELCKWFDLKNAGRFTLAEFGLGLQHMAHHHIADNDSIQRRADEYVRLKIEEIAIFGDTCPKGHPLEKGATRDAGITCSLCKKKQPKGTTMHICEPCAYTCCATCFQSEGSGRQPATKPKLVRTRSDASKARADPANGIVFNLSTASTAACKSLFDGLDLECDDYLTASARQRIALLFFLFFFSLSLSLSMASQICHMNPEYMFAIAPRYSRGKATASRRRLRSTSCVTILTQTTTARSPSTK